MPSLRRLLALFFTTTALVVVALPSIDPDLFWHLGVGRAALAGELVRSEPWSWVAGGQTFYPHSIAHDALLALLYDTGGLLAVALLGALLGALALFLLARLARRCIPNADPLIISVVLLIAALLGAPVWSARAQMWDLIGLLALIILLERQRHGGAARELLLIPLLALAWTFLHGAGLLAGGSVGLLYLAAAAFRRSWRELRRLMVGASGAAVAATLGPLGPALLLYPFETLNSPVQQGRIAEWLPLSIDLPSGALLVALLVAGLAYRVRPATPPPITLLAVCWGLLAAGSVRYLLLAGPLVALVLVPPLVTAIERSVTTLLLRRGAPMVGTGGMRLGTVGASLLLAGFGLSRLFATDYQAVLAADYPVGASQLIVAQGCTANTINNYGFGGYLIEATDIVVGHYGAADAFGDALLGEYVDYVITQRNDPLPYLAAHQVELAVLSPTSGLATYLQSSGWTELYQDPVAIVLLAPGADCRR